MQKKQVLEQQMNLQQQKNYIESLEGMQKEMRQKKGEKREYFTVKVVDTVQHIPVDKEGGFEQDMLMPITCNLCLQLIQWGMQKH